jgi:hypothetical protein
VKFVLLLILILVVQMDIIILMEKQFVDLVIIPVSIVIIKLIVMNVWMERIEE